MIQSVVHIIFTYTVNSLVLIPQLNVKILARFSGSLPVCTSIKLVSFINKVIIM